MNKAAYRDEIKKMWLQGVIPVLATLFLFAQFINTAHAATYGDTSHTHDGQPCIIAAACKQTADFDLALAPVLIAPEIYDADFVCIHSILSLMDTSASFAIRAPPTFFL